MRDTLLLTNPEVVVQIRVSIGVDKSSEILKDCQDLFCSQLSKPLQKFLDPPLCLATTQIQWYCPITYVCWLQVYVVDYHPN